MTAGKPDIERDIPLWIVDAFATAPFTGNQAAVCILPAAAPEGWMQAFAAEMGYSETAYVYPVGDAFALRWFTPEKEVDLCGHATLATAHALWERGYEGPLRFDTKSGRLQVIRDGDDIRMNFPAAPAYPSTAPPGLFEALGIPELPVLEAENGNLLLCLKSQHDLEAVAPNFEKLKRVSNRHGYILSAPGDDADVACRYFVPAWGIDEDPATGSIQCTLAPYWCRQLGRTRIVTHQASKRTARLEAELDGNRVWVSGQAVTTTKGYLASAPPLAWQPKPQP